MADKQWTDDEQTIKSVLAAYAIEGEPNASNVTVSTDASGAHVPGSGVIPLWDGPKFLALPDRDTVNNMKVPPPDKPGTMKAPQDPTDHELTADEAKDLQLEKVAKFNSGSIAYAGYKLPFVTRLKKDDPTHASLIEMIKEVRSRVKKVQISGLGAATPSSSSDPQASMAGLPVQDGDPSTSTLSPNTDPPPKITLNRYNKYQLVLNATYDNAPHDVTLNADWTSSDESIVKVTNSEKDSGEIQSQGKDGTATITVKSAWLKDQVFKVDVEVTTKRGVKPDRSTVKPASKRKAGLLTWTKYGGSLEGWIYDDDASKSLPPSLALLFDKFVGACGPVNANGAPDPDGSPDRQKQWMFASVVRKVTQEGSASSINTYDGMVLTMGSGNAADGALMVIGSASQNDDVRRLLYMCGFKVEKQQPFLPPNPKPGASGLPQYAVKMVDLSDDSTPRILYWDMNFHFYGTVPYNTGKQNVSPPDPDDTIDFKPYDPKYSVHQNCVFYDSGGPHPFNILKHITPHPKPDDDSAGLTKNNIEILHALIALRSSMDPPTAQAFFDIDFGKSLSHVGHGIPNMDKAGSGVTNIGLRSAYIFAAMVTHNWGFGNMSKSIKPYLSKTEFDFVNSGDASDPDRNAMIAKACARRVAVALELERIKAGISRFKGSEIAFESIEGMGGTGWWGYGRVKDYWDEMVTGKAGMMSSKGMIGQKTAAETLASFKKMLGADGLSKLLEAHGVEESALDSAIGDIGLVAVTEGTSKSMTDGFSMVVKTDGSFDPTMFYAKDYTDMTNVGAHCSGNTGYFCVGPKNVLPDLPPVIVKFDRNLTITRVDKVKSPPNTAFVIWKISGGDSDGKFVRTNHRGDFVGDDGTKISSPQIVDTPPDPPATP